MVKDLTEHDLGQFIGTEQWCKVGIVPSITYTDGVKYMAEHGGAYWLIDEIALANRFDKKVMREPFQVWVLKVTGNSAVLTCDDGGKNDRASRVVMRKTIEFTDFPLPEIKLYFTDNVILLPSEY